MKELRLSDWDSQEEQAGGIIEALIGYSGLKRIYLSGDSERLLIGMKGFTALVDILCNSASKIETLYLEDTQLGDEGATILASGLASNSTLSELCISDTDEDDDYSGTES